MTAQQTADYYKHLTVSELMYGSKQTRFTSVACAFAPCVGLWLVCWAGTFIGLLALVLTGKAVL